MADSTYETREALDLLAAAAEACKPDIAGAEQARDALLASLAQLNGQTTVQITKSSQGPGIVVRLDRRSVWVHPTVDGGVVVVGDGPNGSFREPVAGLRYNPISKTIEGTDVDSTIAPVPGHPLPKRSALAVVVDAALKKLR